MLLLKSKKFSIHSLTPLGVLRGNSVGGRLSKGIVQSNFVTKLGLWFGDATFGPGLHRMSIDRLGRVRSNGNRNEVSRMSSDRLCRLCRLCRL